MQLVVSYTLTATRVLVASWILGYRRKEVLIEEKTISKKAHMYARK